MLIVIALVAAQLATGNRLLHFCPVSGYADDPGMSAEESGHDHAHLGSGLAASHHNHSHHHGQCDVHRNGHAAPGKRAARVAPAVVTLHVPHEPGTPDSIAASEVHLPDDGHSHTCSLLSAAKLTNQTRVNDAINSSPEADFPIGLPGWRGVHVTPMEVPYPLWPRPPTDQLDHKPTNSRLASLCRFLL